jgi:hypothetical protein
MEKHFKELKQLEAREWFDFLRNLRVFRGWSFEAIQHLLHYTKLVKYKYAVLNFFFKKVIFENCLVPKML